MNGPMTTTKTIVAIVATAGHAAHATCETMCSIIWHSEVRGVVAKLGGYKTEAGRGYMESAVGISRLNRGWDAGEPVWMAAESALTFCAGAARAAEEDRTDDMNCLLRPYRASLEVE